MSDTEMRALVDAIPVSAFDAPAFVPPLPLALATVAIVTTAGLLAPGQPSPHPV